MTEPTNPQEPSPDAEPAQEQTQAQPPVPVGPSLPPAPPFPPPVAAAPKTRFRDRVLGMRGVAAVAVAGLIIGGAGGAVLGAVTSGDDDRDGGRFGGPGGFGGPGQFQQQLPPGQPGQLPQGGPGQGMPGGGLPPGTSPQDEVQPDNSGYTTSGTNT